MIGICSGKSESWHTQVQIRTALRLRRDGRAHHNRRAAVTPVTSTATLVRYKETINGRAYVIEVSAVSKNRWRAQIARLPGGRAALMPFYGTTAQEAASQLSGWLTRASRAQ
jgi:hypothetical protein